MAKFTHDLYALAIELEQVYTRALRVAFPSDTAYINARYRVGGCGDAAIEAMAQRARSAFDAYSHACRNLF